LQETTAGQTTSYLYGHDLLAQYGSGTWAYHVNDGLGSVRQLADPAGQVVASYSFSPFGVPLGESGGEPYGFTGEQWDASAGLVFLRARYMSPEIGRFISKDPWPGNMRRPQTLNGYLYVGNNPVHLVDPSGRQDIIERLKELLKELQEDIQEWWMLRGDMGRSDVAWLHEPQTIDRCLLVDPETAENIRRLNQAVDDALELIAILRALGYSGRPEGWRNTFTYERFPEDAPLGEKLQDVLARGDFTSDSGFSDVDWSILPSSSKKTHLKQLMDQFGQGSDGRYNFVEYAYVIDAEGNIRVGHGVHHSYLVKGENVYGAGDMYIDRNGNILRIDDWSGHYLPDGAQFKELMKNLLDNLGVKVPGDVYRFSGR
jgi:RHS repeat-associated protein